MTRFWERLGFVPDVDGEDFIPDNPVFRPEWQFGIAPIAWTNDDMPELGAENTFEQCVSEMALAGYHGCEVGNKYPKDPEKLHEALDIRHLQICNAWFSTFLTTKPYEETEYDFLHHIAFLRKMGATVVGVSEQGYSIQGTDKAILTEKHILDDEGWVKLCEGLNKLGKLAADQGITLTYHHHMGTVVQTEEEIDRLMENTDPRYVNLLFDSGHLAYFGGDYMSVLKKYVNRIKHVHLKDVRPEIIAEVKRDNLSFLQGVRMGTFTVPGDGIIDFSQIFDVLFRGNYSGWLVVEAEQDPAKANPFVYAVKARNYIATVCSEVLGK